MKSFHIEIFLAEIASKRSCLNYDAYVFELIRRNFRRLDWKFRKFCIQTVVTSFSLMQNGFYALVIDQNWQEFRIMKHFQREEGPWKCVLKLTQRNLSTISYSKKFDNPNINLKFKEHTIPKALKLWLSLDT